MVKENATSHIEQILEAESPPKNSSYTVTYLPSLKPFKSDEQEM